MVNKMSLCPHDKCQWYDKAKDNKSRACYYGEPQCWRGWLEILFRLLKSRLSKS